MSLEVAEHFCFLGGQGYQDDVIPAGEKFYEMSRKTLPIVQSNSGQLESNTANRRATSIAITAPATFSIRLPTARDSSS